MAHHGRTPAAWTSVVIGTIGFLIGAIALMLDPISMPMFWVGLALAVVMFPLWALLNRLGYGD